MANKTMQMKAWCNESFPDLGTIACKKVSLLTVATYDTIYMSFIATFIVALIGIPLGALLFTTKKGQLLANNKIYVPLSTVVNIVRSVPFIILAVAIIPFTKLLTGSMMGENAMIVPLTVCAIPFVARLTENVLKEVPKGLVEAAQSMGATPLQIIAKVLLKESISPLINLMTVTAITLIGYSAMAGAVGAGGLGNVGITHGYQRYNSELMLYTVIVTVLLVNLVQALGDRLAQKFNHK